MSKDVSAKDAQRYGLQGDPGFSEAWNEAQIKLSIKKTEEIYRKKKKLAEEGIAERSDLIYSYIRHMLKNNKDMKIEEYAGWHNLKKLWGQTRVQEIQERALKLGYKI